MANKFVPKNNNTSGSIVPENCNPSVDQEEKINCNGVDFPADASKRRLQGVIYLVLGFVLATISFFVASLVLSSFEIGWFLKAVISTAVSVLVIKAYDKATGEQPTPMSGPVAHFTIILFVLCLFTGYQNSNGKSAGAFFDGFFFAKQGSSLVDEGVESTIKNEKVSFGIVKHIGETLEINARPNRKVLIKIRGTAAVVNGETIPTGDYMIKVPGDGVISVVGTDNITTSIEVVE